MRLNRPLPTKKSRRRSNVMLAEGCENASTPKRLRLVAEPPERASFGSAAEKSVVARVSVVTAAAGSSTATHRTMHRVDAISAGADSAAFVAPAFRSFRSGILFALQPAGF